MVTVSHIVRKIVSDMQFLHECMGKKLVNYGSVAQFIKPQVEQELGKPVKLSAVMMALRRYSEDLERKYESGIPFDENTDVILKTNIIDISATKSLSLFDKLKQVYNMVDYDKGDTLNVIHGNYEVGIIASAKYKQKILDVLEGEKIIHIEENLVQLSVKISMDYIYTPSVILQMARALNWHNINIFEIVSTLTEVNFVIPKKDATAGYEALQALISSTKNR